jgi:glucose-1-phosphate cytidylyltransferase
MKVVLFCGGLGTRLREHSETIPKPLVNIGVRPIIWHLMSYYAHYGHKDFVLALGYHGELIREYFLNYQEAISSDFTLSEGGKKIELHSSGFQDWRITFVDTGLHSNIGQRLMKVRKYVEGEKTFLANYSDGLSDIALDAQIKDFEKKKVVASFASVRTLQSFHLVQSTADGMVERIGPMNDGSVYVNGGFFVLRSDIFEYIQPGEELVEAPFKRLIEKKLLATYRHAQFWQAMDTFKDKITFDRMEAKGECPWMVWKR